MKTRLYFLDNLRTVLIFFVVMYHAAIVYQNGFETSWIVSDPVKSKSIGMLGLILDNFIMFTIFFISGYFIPNSIKNKTSWSFLKSKVKRIAIPWILAILTLIPLYKVLFLYSRGLSQESWETYFHFFEREGSNLVVFANSPTQSWLWFLPVLFFFQILYYILYKTNLLKVNITFAKGVLLFFVISLAYSKLISFLDLRGWTYSLLMDFQTERLLPYFLIFLLGSLANKLQVFNNYRRNKKVYIGANITFSLALTAYIIIALNYFFNLVYPERNYYFISRGIDSILYYSFSLLTMLSLGYILIDLFILKFNKSSNLMKVLNKGSYNVYIIHMVIIGFVATLLIDSNMNTYLKFSIVTIASFIICHTIIYFYYKIKNSMKTTQVLASVILIFTIMSCENLEKKSLENKQEKTEIKELKPTMGIHEAVIRGNISVIKQYIKLNQHLNDKDPKGGASPLSTAITFDKQEIALALIAAKVDLNSISKDGSTSLHTAAFFGRIKVVEALLKAEADVTIRNKAGANAYETAAAPFHFVEPIYKQLSLDLMPFGFKLDYDVLKKNRAEIAKLLNEK